MVDIVDRSRFATAGAMCDIYHIAQSALQQIGEGHRIARYAQEASTSHTPSSRPPVSSTPSRMQPIRGRGRGRGREGVERRQVRAGDGGAGHGVDIDNSTCTLDASLICYPLVLTRHLPHHSPHLHTLTRHLPHHISYPHTLTRHLPYPHTLTHYHPSPHMMTPYQTLYLSGLDFQVGGLGLDVCIDQFIHHLPRLHQLPRFHQLPRRRLTQYMILLPFRLFILGAVLRELLRRLLVGLIDT